MLFDVKQFEHFFKEKTLKKGLKLFERGALELVERHSGFEYHFFLEGDNLLLRKRGDKLMNYSCSCLNTNYCEHLSAAMFYFQQEALGISVKTKNTKLKKAIVYPDTPLSKNLKKEEKESLLKFIKDQQNELTTAGIKEFLAGKITLFLSDIYEGQIKALLGPYSFLKQLDQKTIEVLVKEITQLLKKIKKQIGNEKDLFHLYLGIVKAFFQVFQMRFTGDEKPIFAFYDSALNQLDNLFLKGLTASEKTEWFNLTLCSVETNKNMQSEAFTFLVPRFVSFAKSEKELLILSAQLKKRAFKTPYFYQFDKLLIARLQTALKEWKLFKTAFPLHQEGGEVELIIAKAELQLCKRNFKSAFTILESHYEEIRLGYKAYYKDYLNYIISNARKNNLHSLELKYLRENFIHQLFIIPEDLERYLDLTPEIARDSAIQELTEAIKNTSKGYYFEKLSLLLLRGNMLDELIRELSRTSNKFSLVHEVALKKYPDYTPAFLTLYMRHLAETLRQDSIYKYQVKVFTTAKTFLDKLPGETAIELIKKLLDQIGKTGHLYRHINEMYDYPFLKEEENY